jgi:DNA-binding PadR family transcriptional regulator
VTTPHVVLGLLAGGVRHGYELKKAHDGCFPTARPLAFGQVYATLDRLVAKGFVRAVATERVDGPDRTVFDLTDAGRAELQAWLAEVEEPAPFVTNPLAVKATIALLAADADSARGYLRRQRAAHLERMRHYTRIKSDPAQPVAVVLGADYALAHLDADLRWLDVALDRVTALDQEVHQ